MIKILDYCIKYSDIKYIRYFEHVSSLRIYFHDGTHIVIFNIDKYIYDSICFSMTSYNEVRI